jgi:hypothetical protein
VPGVLRSPRVLRGTSRRFVAALLGVGALSGRVAQASECENNPHFSTCFDANTLWLPAGRASFVSMPETRVVGAGQLAFGAAGELLHQPVVLRVASPDADGRQVQVLENAFDLSYFVSFGLLRNLEASMLASLRVHQSGAGAGGIESQSATALAHNAVRDPRIGIAYSLDDTLALPGLGLRLAIDATLPLGDRNPFANERSFVVMPNATFGLRQGPLLVQVELGARLRRPVDFAGVSLESQGFVALGLAAAVVPRWLTLSAEAFGLPSLSEARGSVASPRVSSVRLFPAEWLVAAHSSFGSAGPWTVSIAGGSGIALSRETRESSTGPETSYFTGMTTPDFRSLLVVRFVPEAPSPVRR